MEQNPKIHYASHQLKNIFLNNHLLFLIQLPFDNLEEVSTLSQELSGFGLEIKKLSKANLNKQMFAEQISFIPGTNSNYYVTEDSGTKTYPKTFSALGPALQLLRKKNAVIFFLKIKEMDANFEVWYDQARLHWNSSISQEQSFSFQFNHLIQTQGVLPIFYANIAALLQLLNREPNHTK